MKKGLLALAAGLLLGASASFGATPASQLYLIGEPAGGWSTSKGLAMTQTETGVFTIDISLTANKWFGFAQELNSNNNWTTFNSKRYGAPTNNYAPTLGQTVNLLYPSENAFQMGKGDYTITVNTNNNTFVITGQEVEDPTANILYVRGTKTGWDPSDANKMTQDGNTYTLTVPELSGEFKIANSDYSQQFATATAIQNGVEISVSNLGMTNCTLADGTLTNVTIKFVKEDKTKGKLTITGTASGGGDDPIDYDSWYVNVLGDFNSWADNGLNPVDGISTHENLAIGTDGFKVKVYNGTSDTYYVTDGNDIPLDTWTQMYADAYNANPSQIEGATATSVYTVKYNVETNQIYVSLVGGDDPIDYDSWYVNVLGDFNSWADNGVNPVDGISTHENLAIGTDGFKVKVYNGTSDTYYVTDGNDIPLDTWTQMYADAYNANPSQIAGATATSVYTVKYNVETNQIYVSLVENAGTPVWSGVTGGICKQNMGEEKEYPFIINYSITYNADKTLTTTAVFTWENEVPVGAENFCYVSYNGAETQLTVQNANANLREVTSNTFTGTTTATYDKDTQLNVHFKMPVAVSAAEADTTYTVGANGTAPIPTGIDAIENASNEAVYYNMQGVRVENPTNGLYIRVANGKSAKVLVK